MKATAETPDAELAPATVECYRRALATLEGAGVPFLVGGAYAFARYTEIVRHTKDFDLFLKQDDLPRALAALRGAGYEVGVHSPHWLGKAYCGDDFVDLIFSAGNAIARVDDLWFEYAVPGDVLGVPVQLCPAEEMIWSKAFLQERERHDGADVAHLLRAGAEGLDWDRLLARFAENWRVLLAHLVLFGFIYPGERDRVPAWVMRRLIAALRDELAAPARGERVCRGTLLSREQYLPDVERWGYRDARLPPTGTMTPHEIELWTARIEEDGSQAGAPVPPSPSGGSPPDR
ncbi:MAG TPA: hypothetical protein VF121_13935 [Thermoanaerobaculia bacterium]|nr:hypothetical protein [Thermoanaerobaculia bacterium]